MKKLIVSVLLFALIMSFSNVNATVIWVPDSYSTIQQAIDASSDGDTIMVRVGYYYEGAYLDFGTHEITVMSEDGPEETQIQGDLYGVHFTASQTEATVLDGFTVNGNSYGSYGILIELGSPTIRNNLILYNGDGINAIESNSLIENNEIIYNSIDFVVSGGITFSGGAPKIRNNHFQGNTYAIFGTNEAGQGHTIIEGNFIEYGSWPFPIDGGGAIMMRAGDSLTVQNNLITNNMAEGEGGGVFIENYSSPYILLRNCTITENTSNNGDGSAVLYHNYGGASQFLVQNCILWNNSSLSGYEVWTDSDIDFSYTCVENGESAVYGTHTWGSGMISSNPLFATGPDGDCYLSQISAGQGSQSPCVNAGDPASAMIVGTTRTDQIEDASIVDMGYHYGNEIPAPSSPVIYVPYDYATIQQAIDASSNGDTIKVYAGTYNEGDYLDFGTHEVVLMSEDGPEVTTIQGNVDGIHFTSSQTPATVLDGFTVTGLSSTSANGIYIELGSPTIRNNIITLSHSNGILAYGTSSLIENNEISLTSSYTAGAGGITFEGDPIIRNNRLINNASYAIWGDIEGYTIIEGNIIQYNYWALMEDGGALYIIAYDSLLIQNNLIVENYADGPGGGVLIVDNWSPYILLRNCTITNNVSMTGSGSAILYHGYYGDSQFLVQNCILWNNPSNGYDVWGDNGDIDFSYTCVEYGESAVYGPHTWGSGMISSDPLFVTGPDGNFYLSQTLAGQGSQSPCVNAGDPASGMIVGTTRTDLVEDVSIVDMGYHYGNELPTTAPDPPQLVSPGNHGIGVDPDPVTFTWNTVAGSDEYRLEVAENDTFSPSVYTETLTDTTTSTALVVNTDYYWRVFSINYQGETASETWDFSTDTLLWSNGVNVYGQIDTDLDLILVDSENYAALDPAGTDDYDASLDVPKPGAPSFDYLYIAFPHSGGNWPAFLPNWSVDVRDSVDLSATQKDFDFFVETDQTGEDVNLAFNIGSDYLTLGYGLVLYDHTTDVYQDLISEGNTYSYTATGSPDTRNFTLTMGDGEVPTVSFTTPVADETILWSQGAGDTYTLQWDLTSAAAAIRWVRIHYSVDDGTEWTQIVQIDEPDPDNAADEQYVWTIPENYTTWGKLKAEIYTWSGRTYEYATGYNFDLAPDSLVKSFAEAWHICSLPLTATPSTVSAIFGDDILNAVWAFDYLQLGGYTLVEDIEFHQGYWVALDNGGSSASVDIDGSPAVETQSLSLNEGWDLIGTAFPTVDANVQRTDLLISNGVDTIGWNIAALDSGWITDLLYGYNAGYTNATELTPWDGYFIYTLKPDLELITSPPQPSAMDLDLDENESTEEHWLMPIVLKLESLNDQISALGVSSQASDGFDGYDSPTPPELPSGEFLRVVFENPLWTVAYPISRDIRSSEIENETPWEKAWRLTIESSETGDLSVAFDLSELPEGYGALVIWEANIINLSEQQTFAFDYSEPLPALVKVFNSAAVTAGWMDEALGLICLPEEFSVTSFYPNPFNPATTLNFALPEAENVSLKIYNIRGAAVAILADGRYEAGYHTVSFEAVGMASGVYIYHFIAGEHNAVGKLVLMK